MIVSRPGDLVACIAGRSSRHLPLAAAVDDTSRPLNLTVTVAPGAAVPQIGSRMSRCSTMWSPITVGTASVDAPDAPGTSGPTNVTTSEAVATRVGRPHGTQRIVVMAPDRHVARKT